MGGFKEKCTKDYGVNTVKLTKTLTNVDIY